MREKPTPLTEQHVSNGESFFDVLCRLSERAEELGIDEPQDTWHGPLTDRGARYSVRSGR